MTSARLEDPDLMIHRVRRSIRPVAATGATTIILLWLLGSSGGAAGATPATSPGAPPAASASTSPDTHALAGDPLGDLCGAFDAFVTTWYGYPFGIDPATLATDDRRAVAAGYVQGLDAAAERVSAALSATSGSPVIAAGQDWTQAYLAAERGLADAFTIAPDQATFAQAVDSAVAAETVADAAVLASIRALSPEDRATAEPIETCLPRFVRGEPVAGWTSPLTWRRQSRDTFGPRTAWPRVARPGFRAKVVDGEYRMTTKTGDPRWVAAPMAALQHLGDVRLSAAVTIPDGTVDAGLMCREVDGSGYLFVVSPSVVQIRRQEGGASTILAERFPKTLGRGVRAGTPTWVTAECTGSGVVDDPTTLTLSIDGDLVLQVRDRDARLTDGAVALFVRGSEASVDATARFDDLIVWVPEA